jgi:hypothetical protein
VEGNQAMPEEDNASADKDKTMCENLSGCNHNYSILVQYNNELGYFKKTYLDKHPLWPKSCSDCGVLFVLKVDPNIKEKQYNVVVFDSSKEDAFIVGLKACSENQFSC